jgi:hypothetical protein
VEQALASGLVEPVEGSALAAGAELALAAGVVEQAQVAGDVELALAADEEQALADGVQLAHPRTSDGLSPHHVKAELVPI